jgi:hypothetical protein
MYPKNKYIKIYMNKEELIKLRSKSENDIPITKCQTNSSHNREIKKKYSMKKRIMKNFGKYIVKLLNDNIKKINPNVKFREIKIEKFSKKEIRKFMRNNITLFCNLKLIERYKRFKKNVNQLTLNEVKSKLGKDFLNIKISSIYKECFLSNLETQTISLKNLTKKDISIQKLGNSLNVKENPYNLNKIIKDLNNNEQNILVKMSKTLLTYKKKRNVIKV